MAVTDVTLTMPEVPRWTKTARIIIKALTTSGKAISAVVTQLTSAPLRLVVGAVALHSNAFLKLHDVNSNTMLKISGAVFD
ncbi:hypothetical protein ACROYT_G031698 [Oculina patagonica]